MKPLSIPERLTKNRFILDEEESHIEVNQEIARATGTGKAIVVCCPAHVYTEEPDGTISVEYAACLECGTCLAVAGPGALKWHYPAVASASSSAKGSAHGTLAVQPAATTCRARGGRILPPGLITYR